MSTDPVWQVQIDWNGNGDFTNAREDVTADVLSIRINGGRQAANDQFKAATATVVLENPSGVYSRYNSGSPIFGNMLSGRMCKVQATHSAITYPQFLGFLTDIADTTSNAGIPAVTLTFLDAFELLRRGALRIALQEAQRIDQIITTLVALTPILIPDGLGGFHALSTTLDTALTTIAEYVCHRKAPTAALTDIAKNELGGQLYVNRAGAIRWENRDRRLTSAVYATISDPYQVGLNIRQTDLIDEVQFTRAGLSVDAAVSAIATVTPGGAKLMPGNSDPLNTFYLDFSVAGGKAVVSPVATTDYTANQAADGTGADKTPQVTVSAFTAWGGGVTVTFNNADASPVYLYLGANSAFQIRGQAIRRQSADRLIDVTTASPQLAGQVFSDNFDWNDDATNIAAWARYRAATFAVDQPRPQLKLTGLTDADVDVILGIDVSKKLTLALTTGVYPPNLSGTFFVESYDVTWAPDQELACTVGLFSAALGAGNGFIISGGIGAGLDYSLIASSPSGSGDPIFV